MLWLGSGGQEDRPCTCALSELGRLCALVLSAVLVLLWLRPSVKLSAANWRRRERIQMVRQPTGLLAWFAVKHRVQALRSLMGLLRAMWL